jgi:hypothetical protein
MLDLIQNVVTMGFDVLMGNIPGLICTILSLTKDIMDKHEEFHFVNIKIIIINKMLMELLDSYRQDPSQFEEVCGSDMIKIIHTELNTIQESLHSFNNKNKLLKFIVKSNGGLVNDILTHLDVIQTIMQTRANVIINQNAQKFKNIHKKIMETKNEFDSINQSNYTKKEKSYKEESENIIKQNLEYEKENLKTNIGKVPFIQYLQPTNEPNKFFINNILCSTIQIPYQNIERTAYFSSVMKSCNEILKVYGVYGNTTHPEFIICEPFDMTLKMFAFQGYEKIIIEKLINAIYYLHIEMNVVHKKLDLDSIYVSKQNDEVDFKLFGFEYTRYNVEQTIMFSPIDPMFEDPEVLQGKPHSFQTDIYSLGKIIHYLDIFPELVILCNERKSIKDIKYKFKELLQNHRNNIIKIFVSMFKEFASNPNNKYDCFLHKYFNEQEFLIYYEEMERLSKSKESGSLNALLDLGRFYKLQGELQKSQICFEKAAKAGSSRAKEELNKTGQIYF